MVSALRHTALSVLPLHMQRRRRTLSYRDHREQWRIKQIDRGKKEKATEKYRKYDQTQKCIIRNREEQAIQSRGSLKLNNASLEFLKIQMAETLNCNPLFLIVVNVYYWCLINAI